MSTQKRIDEEKRESTNRGRKATEHEVMKEIGAYDTDQPCSSRGSCSQKDEDYLPMPGKRQPKKLDKIMLELPTKDLSKDTAVLCDRLKLSHRSVTSIFAKVILSAGGELKDFVLSKSSVFRHRIIGEKRGRDETQNKGTKGCF